MEIKVITAEEITEVERESIKEIFFAASSKKEFSSDEAKDKFFNTWCGQYLVNYPEYFLFAKKDGDLLGYCCAHPQSQMALEEFKVPGQSNFKEYFKEFPVHLHINCHENSRGMGIGRILIESQAQIFKKGIHIITDRKADNYGFYQALGFSFEVESNFKGHSLLFMGRRA